MPNRKKKCSTETCRSTVEIRSKSGVCRACKKAVRDANARHCTQCDAVLAHAVKGDLCGICISINAQRNRKVCKVCSEVLLYNNITGFCMTHLIEHKSSLQFDTHIQRNMAKPYTVRQLIRAASFLTSTAEAEICGKERFRFLVRLRFAIAYLARPYYSTLTIAKVLGGRDHSTIVHAQHSAFEMRNEPGFMTLLKGVEREALAIADRERRIIERIAA